MTPYICEFSNLERPLLVLSLRFPALFAINRHCPAGDDHVADGESGQHFLQLGLCFRQFRRAEAGRRGLGLGHVCFPYLHGGQ